MAGVSTEYYNPQLATSVEKGLSQFGDADLVGNRSAGFTDQEILDFLDANPGTLNPQQKPGVPGGIYEQVSAGAKLQKQRAESEALRQQELDRIAAEAKSQQERLAREQEERLKQLEIASRTAQQNQLAGSKTAELQLQSISNLPGSQGGTNVFKRKPLQIKPQVSTGLSPTVAATSSLGINV
jgi:hypothetical protein